MRPLKELLRRTLSTQWLHLRAQWMIWTKCDGRARELLDRIVTIDPASFKAHFLLGRLSLLAGHVHEAVQEFAICHRLDSDRLVRRALPAGLLAEVTSRSLSLPVSPLFDLSPADPATLPGEWDDLFGEDPAELSPGSSYLPEGSDFTSAEEYRRFQDRPPILQEELAGVDMDSLLARLVEDLPHPGGTRDQG